ncbi:MAG: DUF3332 family protein [Planctomycetota bacterium]|jgi:hypothetical protein
MKLRNTMGVTALLLLATLTTGCFGPMNASTRLKVWNSEIENRWGGEGVFILLKIPWGGIYAFTFLGDALIFNPIEFWGGTNPIDPVDPKRLERVKKLNEWRHEGKPYPGDG